jgi:hypothetical protein
MTQNTKLALIYGGGIVFASAFAYWMYTIKKNKASVADNAIVDNFVEQSTPTPTKPNPFTEMLKNPLPSSIGFKPKEYTFNNPFADVNTAIANVNPFNSNANNTERLV